MQVLYEVRRRAQDTLVVTASFDLMLYSGEATAGARRQLLLEVQYCTVFSSLHTL